MGSDLLVVLIIALVLVIVWRGPKTLPKIGQALGRGVREARSEAELEARAARMNAYQFFMPIKRISQPEEQAAAIAFLASDDASYVNGVSLDVNGGLFMA